MIYTTHAPADNHSTYSVGLGRTSVKAHVNGCEIDCTYEPASGAVTLRPRAGYFDAASGSIIAGQAPVKRGDRIEIRWS